MIVTVGYCGSDDDSCGGINTTSILLLYLKQVFLFLFKNLDMFLKISNVGWGKEKKKIGEKEREKFLCVWVCVCSKFSDRLSPVMVFFSLRGGGGWREKGYCWLFCLSYWHCCCSVRVCYCCWCLFGGLHKSAVSTSDFNSWRWRCEGGGGEKNEKEKRKRNKMKE